MPDPDGPADELVGRNAGRFVKDLGRVVVDVEDATIGREQGGALLHVAEQHRQLSVLLAQAVALDVAQPLRHDRRVHRRRGELVARDLLENAPPQELALVALDRRIRRARCERRPIADGRLCFSASMSSSSSAFNLSWRPIAGRPGPSLASARRATSTSTSALAALNASASMQLRWCTMRSAAFATTRICFVVGRHLAEAL